MPIDIDKYATYEKYYPYKKEDGYKSDYYTIDKSIYEESVHLNKLYKIDLIIAYLTVLWIVPLIAFGALNLWLWFLFSFIGVIIQVVVIGVFETNLNDKYFNLWKKFINTEEFIYQKEQEELHNKLKHEQKVYEETKNIVETYNILDNKKLSRENKIKRLMNYIEKFKEK